MSIFLVFEIVIPASCSLAIRPAVSYIFGYGEFLSQYASDLLARRLAAG
jgi:hypothetical protein